MRIAKEGLREILIAVVVCGGLGAVSLWAALTVSLVFIAVPVVCLDVLTLILLFFRDPQRTIPQEAGVLVSPADGKVTEVSRLDRYEGIDGPAHRVSIFLSIFDVHVNRIPCDGFVKRIDYRPGEFLDARHSESGSRNEANTITIEPRGKSAGPVIVRQVAGKIARRIVCSVKEGDAVERGQRLGVIKFGSRADLVVPAASGLEPCVKVNDVVRGGASVLFRPSHAAQRESAAAESRREEAAVRC